jgi:hypothetical protein
VGPHSITANYTPSDPCGLPSASNKLFLDVASAPTTVTLAAPSEWPCGEKMILRATVSPVYGGTVTFLDGGNPIGTSPVDAAGVAELSVPGGLSAGPHSLTANYTPSDPCGLPSTSNKVDVNVVPRETTLQLIAPPKLSCGDKLMLTATVGANAGGLVSFFDGGTPLGSVPVGPGGTADLSIPGGLAIGIHSLTATLATSDPCYLPSVSNKVVHEVNPVTTSVTLTSDPNPAKFGTKVLLTATISPAGTGGTVTFFDGGNPIGTSPVDMNGVATLSVTDFTTGGHQLTASFNGNLCFGSSTSQIVSQHVDPDNPPTITMTQPIPFTILFVGQVVKIAWIATDDHLVTSIDLYVSIDNGTTYTPIAIGIPNTGTYVWTAPGPGHNVGPDPVYDTYVKGVAHDNVGQTGSGQTGPLALYDLVTPTLVTAFEATPVGAGIEVQWQLAASAPISDVTLERSTTSTGPWTAVRAEKRQENGITVVLDSEVAAGSSYYYRLNARAENGTSLTFGPVQGTAQSLRVGLTSITPNPARGPARIDYALARQAHVHLGVVDVQGREIAVLADGVAQPGGYQVMWDGSTTRGRAPAGVYFVRLLTDGQTFVRRIALTR